MDEVVINSASTRPMVTHDERLNVDDGFFMSKATPAWMQGKS